MNNYLFWVGVLKGGGVAFLLGSAVAFVLAKVHFTWSLYGATLLCFITGVILVYLAKELRDGTTHD